MTTDPAMTRPSAPRNVGADSDAAGQAPQLSGRLGTAEVVFSVIAWAAPLLVVVGLMPAMVQFAGYGIVGAFIVVTLILLVFAVGYAAITRYVENPGAFYAYITAGLGKRVGLGGAFMAVFGYLLLLVPTWVPFGVFGQNLITNLGGPEVPWYVLALAGCAFAGFCAYRRIAFSARVLAIALSLEVLVVVIFDVAVFARGGADGVSLTPFTWAGVHGGNFGLAILFAALCFIGFESSAIYREEAKDPLKTIPRATYTAVIMIGVFYCIAAWALVTALGPDGVANASSADVSTMFNDLANQYVGKIVSDVVAVLSITSVFACELSAHNAVTRYGYSLGRDGILPERLGRAHPKYDSPYMSSIMVTALEIVALILIAAFTGMKALGGDAYTVYVVMVGEGAVVVVALMVIVSIAVLRFFRANPELARNLSTWQTTVAPALALIGLALIFVLGVVNFDVLIGGSMGLSIVLLVLLVVVFAAGLAVATILRSRKPETYARIGRQ